MSCNGCHDLMQTAMSFNDVAIIFVHIPKMNSVITSFKEVIAEFNFGICAKIMQLI